MRASLVGSLLVVVLAALQSGCGDAEPPTCVPGEQVSCTCGTGTSGAQQCSAEGVFGECSCVGSDAATDSADADAMVDASLPEDGGDAGDEDAQVDSASDVGPDSESDGGPADAECVSSDDPPVLSGARIGSNRSTVCAIRADGRLMCWGNDQRSGLLGLGDAELEGCRYGPCAVTPQEVAGLSDVRAVYVGQSNVCAVYGTARELACWGDNSAGAVLDAADSDCSVRGPCARTPRPIPGLLGVSDVAIGLAHVCAVHDSGVSCWGLNRSAQLGVGDVENRATPVAVDLDDVVDLSASSSRTCATLSSGEVWCWGFMQDTAVVAAGPLEDCVELREGAPGDVPEPCSVRPRQLDTPVRALATYEARCLVAESGDVMCWGLSFDGSLGTGLPDEDCALSGEPQPCSTRPQTVGCLDNAKQLWTSGFVSCALLPDGRPRCWGPTWQELLGHTPRESCSGRRCSVTPDALTVVLGAALLPAVDEFAYPCAIVGNTVACWGQNEAGALGDGTTVDRGDARTVAGLTVLE